MKRSGARLPGPNPVRLPTWLQLLLWIGWPTRALDHFAATLSEPFTIRLAGTRAPYVVVSSPRAVEEVLTRFPDAANEELRPFLGDHSLFLLRGASHVAHRRPLMSHLGQGHVELYGESIQERTFNAASRLKVGESVPLGQFAERIAADVIGDVIFGDRSGAAISQLLLSLTSIVTGPAVFVAAVRRDLGRFSPGHTISRRLAELEASILTEIATARRTRTTANSGGVLQALINATDGRQFTDAELLDEIKTLLAAGHAPTAAAVAWALYWIHADPSIRRRLEEELASWRPGQFEPLLSANHGLTYLDMVCRETLRIVPVVPAVDREVPERMQFCGHSVDTGMRLVACSYLTHRRPEIFAEPARFRPERFAARSYSAFEYYPFGGGRRRCVGAFLSVFQMKLVLATVLKRVRFRVPHDSAPVVWPRGIIFAPSRRLELTVQEVLT